ncbi:MAG: terpene cyclase/mutase family protein [Planctomycetes bacterium]|nr:terpene cyclase/mutase family protein [Planctomycetota bacterium]
MQHPPLMATALALVVPFTPSVQAQRKPDREALLEAAEQILHAVHAADRAELALLRNSRRDAQALAAVRRAIRELSAARKRVLHELDPSRPTDRRAEVQPAEVIEAAEPSAPAVDPQAVRQAIDRALKWLHARQDPDGKWDSDGFMKHDRGGRSDNPGNPVHDVGVTGLALLAFLGEGSTLRNGRYQETVKKAVAWLREQQGEDGVIGTTASHDFIYDHAIATYALCEAFGLSDYKMLRANAQRAINYLEHHRNPYACWRYQPRDNDNDSSVTSWCLKAYRSAADHDLKVNPQAFKIMAVFFDELTDPATGQLGYTKRGEPSSRHPGDHVARFPVEKGEALTAAGLSGRFLLGQKPATRPAMQLAAARLLAKLPDPKDPKSIDHYYWFHGTLGMAAIGGDSWQRWSRAVVDAILQAQETRGPAAGSWRGAGPWGEDGGRIYATALLASTLQVVERSLALRKK